MLVAWVKPQRLSSARLPPLSVGGLSQSPLVKSVTIVLARLATPLMPPPPHVLALLWQKVLFVTVSGP
jgi:hypothetical protein